MHIDYPNQNGRYVFRYTHRGEFRMGCEGYGLLILKDGETWIDFFADRWAFVGQLESNRCPLQESHDGRYLLLSDNHDSLYAIDLQARRLSVVRTTIRMDQHVVEENAVWGDTQLYVQADRPCYVQFPFCDANIFDAKLSAYKALRAQQLQQLIEAE